MNKRTEEKAKNDRMSNMSNQATFIVAKGQESASLTAKIETKLTWQGEPAVEAESMKNEFKDAELPCAEPKGGPGQRERSGSRGTPSQSRSNVPQWRVSPHRRWKSSCQTLDFGSRQALVVVSIRTVTFRLANEMVCLLNAELDGDDSKKPCCIRSFDEISAEKMIRSD